MTYQKGKKIDGKLIGYCLAFFLQITLVSYGQSQNVEKWGIFEVSYIAKTQKNPFTDVSLTAYFSNGKKKYRINGFYDGNDTFKIRFMPNELGEWHYKVFSNESELDNKSGTFFCIPTNNLLNKGPVRVNNKTHFFYSEGTNYFPFGTTSYAWIHQADTLEEQTLNTLRNSPFNKIRMCVFPKAYTYNDNEPQFYPYLRDEEGNNNYTHFDPDFFKHLEKRLTQLMELGIEADLILFHPYDRWGYSNMGKENDKLYIEYILARLASFRNIWWSLANEYDLMLEKSMQDWHDIFKWVDENDPYNHLVSIHNCREFYDHSLPWVSHASIQSSYLDSARAWMKKYDKPLIFDECRYEGDMEETWGNLSAQELVHRFWLGFSAGAYVGHSETYKDPEDIIWWSKGGVLYGKSPQRINFLRKIIEQAPLGLHAIDNWSVGLEGEYYLYYFKDEKLKEFTFNLEKWRNYSVEIIDTWEMSSQLLPGTYGHKFKISLPEKPYLAVLIKKAEMIYSYKSAEITPDEDLFMNKITITLHNPLYGDLRYTTDGSEPTLNSKIYSKPFTINENTTVKAKAFGNNQKEGETITREFKRAELREASIKTKKLEPGIQFNMYKGLWETIPDFTALPIQKNGINKKIDLTPSNLENSFGMVYNGYLKIPDDGIYRIYLDSDDGSRLYLEEQLLIDNNGIHGPLEKSIALGLKKGYHKIKVEMFENNGGEKLLLSIKKPGEEKMEVPTDMYFFEKVP